MTDFISDLSTFLNSIVWGAPMLTLLIFSGVVFSAVLGFPQLTKLKAMLRCTVVSAFSKENQGKSAHNVSSFQAFATAMAGTIGTGSIAGLATAIVLGGPGAVFWMWVSAFFGMATKYAEIALAVKFREKNADGRYVGGPMYYIKNGLKKGRGMATAFCILAMIAAFGTGNAVQSNSIALVLDGFVPVHVVGIVLSFLAAMVILGGVKRIATVNERLVPFMAVFYIVCAIMCVWVNRHRVDDAFYLIFSEAFKLKSAAGGAAGYGMGRAMQYGFSRGVFSNEAGLGTAPIVHASADTKSPQEQALWGVFDVFFTTMVIGTLTALVILTTDLWQSGSINGAQLSIMAFDAALPKIGAMGVGLSAVLFALSSIFGWAYYGEVSVGFLLPHSKRAVTIYRLFYIAFVYMGAVGSINTVWSLSSALNGLMAIPNLISLFLLMPECRKLNVKV